MTVIHSAFGRASLLGWSLMVVAVGLFAGCGSSASSAGSAGSAAADLRGGAGGKSAGGSGGASGGKSASGGAGGASGGSAAGGAGAGAGAAQGGSAGCAQYGQSCSAERACCVGLVCAGGCVMMPVEAGGTGGTGGAGGNSSGVDCRRPSPVVFPTFDRSCATPSDCSAVVHQVDCCGTRVVTGIRASELARFATAEQACEAQEPACGCATQPTTTDTGQVATSTSEPVQCLTGTCTTYVP